MSCDTCKKVVKELEPVTSDLSSATVKTICAPCREKYNRLITRYRKFAWKRLKKKMKKDSLSI